MKIGDGDMFEKISRLMDGELEGAEADAALRDLTKPEAVSVWVCYHIIRDTLRRSGAPAPGFSRRFAARLAAEPTVIAPRPREMARLPFLWAVAATVAAVLVVGWVTLSTLEPQPTALAKAREAITVRTAQATSQPVSPDFLFAHQEYSPTMQIQGVDPSLRAVSGRGD
jgi:sigma-E factor negative regulatory protein RseA